MAKVSGAVIIELLGNKGDPTRYTVANANSITKGDLLFLLDPRTVSGANLASGQPVAGIAAMDKEASDGATSMSVWTNGIFDLVVGLGGCTVGNLLMVSGGNYVIMTTAAHNLLSGAVLCKALETGTAEEYIACKTVCI